MLELQQQQQLQHQQHHHSTEPLTSAGHNHSHSLPHSASHTPSHSTQASSGSSHSSVGRSQSSSSSSNSRQNSIVPAIPIPSCPVNHPELDQLSPLTPTSTSLKAARKPVGGTDQVRIYVLKLVVVVQNYIGKLKSFNRILYLKCIS